MGNSNVRVQVTIGQPTSVGLSAGGTATAPGAGNALATTPVRAATPATGTTAAVVTAAPAGTTTQPTLAQELGVVAEAVQVAERAIQLIMTMMPHAPAAASSPPPQAGSGTPPDSVATEINFDAPPSSAAPPVPAPVVPAPPVPAPVVPAPPVASTPPPPQGTAQQLKGAIAADAKAAVDASQARLAELDGMVANHQITDDQAQAERLKLHDTIQGVQGLARLSASLPTDLNPQAAARFQRLRDLVAYVANDQIDKEQVRAEAYDIKASLLVPDSDAPGPLADARASATTAISEGESAKNGFLQRMKELQGMVASQQVTAAQAWPEILKLGRTYQAVSAFQNLISHQPIDRAANASPSMSRLGELMHMVADNQIDPAQSAAEVYLLTQALAHPALAPDWSQENHVANSVAQRVTALADAAADKKTRLQSLQELDMGVASGQLTSQQADAQRAAIAQALAADDATFAAAHVPAALRGFTSLEVRGAASQAAMGAATAQVA